MTRRVTKLLGLVVIGIAVAGCTNSTPGNASATTPVTTPATSSGSAPAGSDPLANVDPCTLLGSAIVHQNQLTPGQHIAAPGARTCSWDNNANATSSGYTISIGIYDKAGLDQLSTAGFTVNDYPVGKHQGRLSKDPAGHTCAVSIGVTPTSRVDVVGIDGAGQQDRACVVAQTVAPSVEQTLSVRGN